MCLEGGAPAWVFPLYSMYIKQATPKKRASTVRNKQEVDIGHDAQSRTKMLDVLPLGNSTKACMVRDAMTAICKFAQCAMCASTGTRCAS